MQRGSALLNQQLSAAVTGLRFGEIIVIADAGLPVPAGVATLDLALTNGIPSVDAVVRVLKEELVIEEVIIAAEMRKVNPTVSATVDEVFTGTRVRELPHDDIEELLPTARLIVQTGETTPYGNVLLVGGLDFFALGMADGD
ncbi:D-ribose pyranase [Agromyces badenianii]|uniref:D-ribose pyranase n=1 Tax=Agromyces badenianii TaxID=2080742 RepID=A0A2S0WSR4_9MICO|nr:D-ribose pyranase [Agromyces badenianii]AWB94294.1 D-ribose pyranase [Agromyces badenianii]